ncbi:MAG: acyl-ACP--UDP-N-acetylglucosamine O-acyltransferase [Planctomycetota bacterium]
MAIHPTAVVDSGARLGPGVEVGPYVVIGKGVVVGARTTIGPHVCLSGPLELGEDNVVEFSAALGLDPQVKGRRGPWGATRIGHRNVFREFSQVNRSMKPDGCTVVGDDGFFMATSHVGHDCTVGNHVVLCNGVLLSGHVEVQDRAFLAGGAGVQQFSRVGELVMVGGNAGINRDVPPFCMVVGNRPGSLSGLNRVGLKRAGVPGESVRALKAAFRTLFRGEGSLVERIAAVERGTPEVERLLAFVQSSKRGIIGMAGGAAEDDDD